MKSLFNLVLLFLFLVFIQIFPSLTKGASSAVLANPLLVFGLMVTGAYISARLSGRAALVAPRYGWNIGQGLLGGYLMGAGFALSFLPVIGTQLAMVHGVFYWASYLMPQGLLYLTGMFLGGGIAAFLQKKYYPGAKFTPLTDAMQNNITRFFRILSPVTGVLFALSALYVSLTSGGILPTIFAVIASIIAGILLERNRICMGLMMKEIYFTRSRQTLFKVAAIMVALTITWLLLPVTTATATALHWAVLPASFVMGFGYMMADGCFMGSIWKSGQGNITSVFALLGMFFGVGSMTPLVSGKILSAGSPAFTAFASYKTLLSLTTFPDYLLLSTARAGLVLFLFFWTASYFLNRPAPTIKKGPALPWLLSEGAIAAVIILLAISPGRAIPIGFRLAGLLLFYLSLGLYAWARLTLGKNWGEAILMREGHNIITEGPYRLVKHPIYLSVVTGLSGLGLVFQKPWALAGVLLLVLPSFILRARHEEKLLSGLPGAGEYFSQMKF